MAGEQKGSGKGSGSKFFIFASAKIPAEVLTIDACGMRCESYMAEKLMKVLAARCTVGWNT